MDDTRVLFTGLGYLKCPNCGEEMICISSDGNKYDCLNCNKYVDATEPD